jgi:hypothetical protein
MKKLYRTVIQIEVLSDEPYNGSDLETIAYDITDGHCSGLISDVTRNQILEGSDAVAEVRKHGTDLEFFDMDENGTELDVDYLTDND